MASASIPKPMADPTRAPTYGRTRPSSATCWQTLILRSHHAHLFYCRSIPSRDRHRRSCYTVSRLLRFWMVDEAQAKEVVVRGQGQFLVACYDMLGIGRHRLDRFLNAPGTQARLIVGFERDVYAHFIHDGHVALCQHRVAERGGEGRFHLGQLLLDLAGSVSIVNECSLHFFQQFL